MYTVSDAVEMGEAHKLVLALQKPLLTLDDADPRSSIVDEHFDD